MPAMSQATAMSQAKIPALHAHFAALAVALVVAVCGLGLLPTAPRALAFPQPSLFPVEWQLDFTSRTPQRIVVGDQAYWYMVYTVTNYTDEERAFFPAIDLVTKTGEVIRANRGIDDQVFEAIKQRTRADLQKPQYVYRLLIGEDQAVSTVAIWEEPMVEMGTFDIFIGGLSGETVRLTDAEGNELKDEDGLPILVRKTKQLRYRVRGDAIPGQRDSIVQEKDDWIMR